jgi:hypothetical protein
MSGSELTPGKIASAEMITSISVLTPRPVGFTIAWHGVNSPAISTLEPEPL